MDGTDIRQAVQKQYGAIAAAVTSGTGASCCAPSCCSAEDPKAGVDNVEFLKGDIQDIPSPTTRSMS